MAERLEVALVTTFYPPHHFGGDALFVRALAHTLARQGHHVDVIYDVDVFRSLSGSPDLEPLPEPPGVRVHRLNSRFGRLSVLATQQVGRPVFQGRRIRQILEGQHFDVIHFHNISLLGGPSVLAYGHGIKLYTTHEHWLVCPTHVLWRHNRELCTERECLRCVIRHRRPPQLWRWTGLIERAGQHVDAFCAPTRFTARKHRELGFPFDMEIFPHFLPSAGGEEGVEPEPAESGIDSPYFLFAGRLEELKGLQDVLPHFTASSPAELLIAGSGSYEPRLRELAGRLPRVRFLGNLPSQRMPALIRGALALVMPSLCFEVFPLVVLEAFREGVPVIARRLGPLPELLEEANGGLLFENAAELKQALDRLAADTTERQCLGEAGRRAFLRLWSEKAFLERYYSLVERFARQRGARLTLERLAATRDLRDTMPAVADETTR